MARYIQVVLTNCPDQARVDEFNRWYNEVHVPDVLKVPGVIGATRYFNCQLKGGEPRFLALYEIESDDIDATLKTLMDTASTWFKQGRIFKPLEVAGVYTFEPIPLAEGPLRK